MTGAALPRHALRMFEASTIGAAVQLAIAPIFLLTGVGALLSVMTQRLSRVIDRARAIETWLASEDPDEDLHRMELAALSKRMSYANFATILCACSALSICIVVCALFMNEMMTADLGGMVAALFVLTMVFLAAGLGFFVAEVSVAMKVLRVRTDLLSAPPKAT